MKERPILFSGPMVRALLAGAKTQTRRLATPGEFGASTWEQLPADLAAAWARDARPRHPRFGERGDRLWIRETWCLAHPDYHDEAEGIRSGRPIRDGRWCHYAASDDVDVDDGRSPWRSPIHQPRWASRITLEVTDVRVQRLHEISEDDTRAEGVDAWMESLRGKPDYDHNARLGAYPVTAFARLWDSINGAGAWDANPWVWAISFRRVS